MSKEMRQQIDKFNKFKLTESENLNISDVRSSKIIISIISSSMEWDIFNVEKGIITIGKWTKLEGGTFSIWKSVKPIFEILNTEELYNFMLGKRIQIEKDRFEDGFENIQ
jgi:hypothetical protein